MPASPSTLRVDAHLDNLAAIRRFVEDAAEALDIDPATIGDIVQSVDESATNIIEHGYRGSPGMIEVEIKREGKALLAVLRDQAPPFDPTQRPPPDITLPLEQRPLGGLGVYLTKMFMDRVIHRVTPEGGNELTLVKNIQA